jgi:glycosyltransferase involved in cell wall biosynthesis
VEGFGERLRAVAGSFRPAIVQIEPHEMAQYLPALDGLPVRRLLVDHDPGIKAAQDFSAAARGPARLLRRLDVLAWRRYARRSAGRLDGIVAFSEADRAVVNVYAGAVPVTVIPFTIELPPIPADPRGADPPSLLFFGGYRHPPNADAALRLQRSIFPAVRARHPDVQLELLGGGATSEMLAAAGEGILLRGHVPELAPFLDRAALVVAPIRLGGGMRVKVLEALAAGKAVVASPRAAEGLDVEDGHELVLADTDEAFVAAVSGLLADEERRVELARAARRWAERELGEDRFVAAYEALYARLLAAP